MPVSYEHWEESRWLVPSQPSTTVSPYHWWTENCWWPRGILKSPLQTVVSAQLDELPSEDLVMTYLWACTVHLQSPFVSVFSDLRRSPRAMMGTLFLWIRKWGAQRSRRTMCDEAGSLHCGWPCFLLILLWLTAWFSMCLGFYICFSCSAKATGVSPDIFGQVSIDSVFKIRNFHPFVGVMVKLTNETVRHNEGLWIGWGHTGFKLWSQNLNLE